MDDQCQVDGCDRKRQTRRGWCLLHYKRWMRSRDKNDPTYRKQIRGNDVARFWSKIVKSHDPNGCWIWIGAIFPGGYGNCFWKKKSVGAHRVSWILEYGEIPKGIVVRHKNFCGIPLCSNPLHLELGTIADNNRDKVKTISLQCHPGRKHYAKGLCKRCYEQTRKDMWRAKQIELKHV